MRKSDVNKRPILTAHLAAAMVLAASLTGCTNQESSPTDETKKVETDGKIAYLAQAPVYECLTASQRNAVELGEDGESALLEFAKTTVGSLYQTAMDDGEVNFLYSPASLYLALSVLSQTQTDEAAAELYALLGVNNKDEMTQRIQTIMSSLMADGEGEKCRIGNSIWFDNDPDVSGGMWKPEAFDTFDRLSKQLHMDVYAMDLQSEEAGEQKNKWMSDNTGGLLGTGEPAPWEENTCMVILNSVYMNKDWSVPFEKNNTHSQPFYKAGGESVDCEMMYCERGEYGYVQTDTYTASALPYKDGSYMLFALPNEGTAPGELLESDLLEAVSAWENGDILTADQVRFSVPKLDYSVHVGEILELLKKHGLSKSLSPYAFKNLSDEGLAVENIFQDARIQVDELGTRAAAVTEIDIKKNMAPMPGTVVDITLDRPYAYVVVSANGTILFTGVVNDPTER